MMKNAGISPGFHFLQAIPPMLGRVRFSSCTALTWKYFIHDLCLVFHFSLFASSRLEIDELTPITQHRFLNVLISVQITKMAEAGYFREILYFDGGEVK